jgi:hypothetical protein
MVTNTQFCDPEYLRGHQGSLSTDAVERRFCAWGSMQSLPGKLFHIKTKPNIPLRTEL